MANLSNINNKFLVTTGGNVGINTTSPAQKVEIAGGYLKFSGGDYGIQGSASLTYNPVSDHYFQASGSTKVTIKASGNVGIGTNNPLAVLSIGSGSLTDANIPVQISTSGGTSQKWFGVNKDGNYGLLMGYLNGGSIGDAGAGAYIRNITEDPLYFMVSNSDLAMTIISNKNVGIGTASPENILHIETSNAGGPQIQLESTSGTASAAFINFDSTSLQLSTQRDMVDGDWYDTSKSWGGINIQGPPGGSFITFHTAAASNSSPTERMRIFSNGNVNIGVAETGSSAVTGPFVVTHTSSRFLTSSYEESSVSLSAKNNNNNLETLRLAGDSIKFFNGTNAVGSQKMVILNNGNVGIGMGGPPSKLTVMESTLCTNSGTDGGTSYVPSKPILLVTTDGNGTPSTNYATNSVFTVGIGGGITGGVTTEHLRVNLNGNVGIGTASPSEILHINGGGSGPEIRLQGTWGSHYIRAYNDNWNFLVGGTVQAINIKNNGNISMGTSNNGSKLNVGGRIAAATNNLSSGMIVPRSLEVSYGGSSTFTYTFNPVTLFGNDQRGGQVLFECTGWQLAMNNGYIMWRNAGGSDPIGTNGSVQYVQTAYVSGGQSGSNTIAVSLTSGTNDITITFTGWHGNSHGFMCRITTNYS